jgi:F0F1-type ATP synthase membrane subunit b/b'
MIKLLSSLLSLLDRLWAAWNENKLRQQGRQEAIKEANDEINRQIELGEAAIATPDPERDERLRNRFDRSRTPK